MHFVCLLYRSLAKFLCQSCPELYQSCRHYSICARASVKSGKTLLHEQGDNLLSIRFAGNQLFKHVGLSSTKCCLPVSFVWHLPFDSPSIPHCPNLQTVLPSKCSSRQFKFFSFISSSSSFVWSDSYSRGKSMLEGVSFIGWRVSENSIQLLLRCFC